MVKWKWITYIDGLTKWQEWEHQSRNSTLEPRKGYGQVKVNTYNHTLTKWQE